MSLLSRESAPTRSTLRAVTDAGTGRTIGAPSAGTPEIDVLEQSVDALDSEILDAVRRRAELSAMIGRAREATGAPRFAHSREMDVLHHFTELGSEGHTLAMLLLRLGRHKLAG